MIWDSQSFLRRLRTKYTGAAFSLNLLGTTHHIVYAPELIAAVLDAESSRADSAPITRRLLVNVFGFPARELGKYDAALAELMACYAHSAGEGEVTALSTPMWQNLKKLVPEFVTGSESLVDQTQWERAGGARMMNDDTGERMVEASLLPLVRDFCAHVTTPSIVGSDFLGNFPTFFDDLWTLHDNYWWLAAGLPRWVPIPSVTRAHIARRNLLSMLGIFHEAMEKQANGGDPGPDWQYLESIRGVVGARMLVYRKHGFSIAARAAMELALLCAVNAKSNMLVVWMVNRIHADKALLELIREEIAAYIHAVHPKKEFVFVDEPPVFDKWNINGVCTNCPVLKSCYTECLRLDTASWSSKMVLQDFVLQTREKSALAWSMRKREYVHAAHDLHSTNSEYFTNPSVWIPHRHVTILAHKGANMDANRGSIRPYGGGSSVCKGRDIAFRQCMTHIAALVAMWDIEPAGGLAWQVPKHTQATSVYCTGGDTRVWIRRRKLLEQENIDPAH